MEEQDYRTTYELEGHNWWFVGMRSIALSLLGGASRPAGAGDGPVRVLDVGCGTGILLEQLEPRAPAIGLDFSPTALEFCRKRGAERLVQGRGEALPFADGSFDLCFSSNVLEHVAAPWALLEEMVRCVRRDGVVFCAFTNWLSPWGGHETSPWHLLGGDRAARRYERRRGRPPKNRYGVTLFPVHVGEVLGWARRHSAVELVDARPRYHPGWCRHLVEVPGLREVATWNLALVLRRR